MIIFIVVFIVVFIVFIYIILFLIFLKNNSCSCESFILSEDIYTVKTLEGKKILFKLKNNKCMRCNKIYKKLIIKLPEGDE